MKVTSRNFTPRYITMLCVQYHNVYLVFDRQTGTTSETFLRLAFGHLTHNCRKALCMSSWAAEVLNKKILKIQYGMGNIMPYVSNDPSFHYLPRCLPGLKEKIDWQHTINEELMQKTWHPERLTKWSLDTEELVDVLLTHD